MSSSNPFKKIGTSFKKKFRNPKSATGSSDPVSGSENAVVSQTLYRG